MFKKKQWLLGGLLASSALLGACSSQTIATGDGFKVTKDDVFNLMKKDGGGRAVKEAILSHIVDKELTADEKKEIAERAKHEVDAVKDQSKDGKAPLSFEDFLKRQGYADEAQYTKGVEYDLGLKQVISKQFNITEDDIKALYEKKGDRREVSHILVDSESEAQNIIQQLNNGADFEKLAVEKTKDPSGKQTKGRLGMLEKGQTVKPFEDAAFDLKEGEITQTPVKTEYGYHVIKVTKIEPKRSFDDMKEQLKREAINDKKNNKQAMNQAMKALFDKYKVNISDKNFKHIIDDLTKPETPKKKPQNKETQDKDTQDKDAQDNESQNKDAQDKSTDADQAKEGK